MIDEESQTEEISEEELDWDLSDHVDRETQTLPPNATLFQRSRTEAIVQTDYRYLPLAGMMCPNLPSRLILAGDLAPIKAEMTDAITQTEQTTNSVSTQTEHPVEECLVSNSEKPTAIRETGNSREADDERRNSTTTSEASESISSVTSPLRPHKTVPRSEDESATPYTSDVNPSNHLMNFYDFGAILDELMPSFKMAPKSYWMRKRMVSVGIQTEDEMVIDDSPRFAPRAPLTPKSKLLANVDLSELDLHAMTVPFKVAKDSKALVDYLCGGSIKGDIQKVRLISRWIAENIRFDLNFVDKEQTVEEILSSQRGVAKDFVLMFTKLCSLTGVKVKRVQGFARGHDFRVGRVFNPDKETGHHHPWVVVFIFGFWRLLDPTWVSGYTDEHGRFHPSWEEHFFLTDPKDFIMTHFPFDEEDANYERWQLLDHPISLEEFNQTPKVSPQFFHCSMRLRVPRTHTLVFKQQTELQVASSNLLKFKYKFYPEEETEESVQNEWVFCQLKEGGVVGSFTINAPRKGRFILSISACLDDQSDEDDMSILHVISFILISTQARKYPVPWPLHDGAWGPTPRLYECGLDPVNQNGPILVTWGGKRQLYFEKIQEILLMFQMFDSQGNFLESKGILKKEETEEHIKLTIISPGIGFYKLLMYGIPKPSIKGRWKLPLLASYLVECKISLSNAAEASKQIATADTPTSSRMLVGRR